MQKTVKRRAVRRLKIVEGQIRGLQKMVEKEAYCIDIMTQTSAVRHALSGVEDILLRNHLSTHVIEQIRAGKEPKAIREILSVYTHAKRP